jgi:hypothetical protein
MVEDWLTRFVSDYAEAVQRIDGAAPVWTSTTTGKGYQPVIGPHPETEVVRLIANDLGATNATTYRQIVLGFPYPMAPKQKCDVVVTSSENWAIEVKMLRLMGDNGKANDNMLMHILSPYPAHRSALTDCEKLAVSGFDANLAVLIYGFDYPAWPMDPAIDAFEQLAGARVVLGDRAEAHFSGLIHPVHNEGRVFAWSIQPMET